jgi:hypothetical protein
MSNSNLPLVRKKLKKVSTWWILGLILAIPGCASVFGSRYGNVSIRSEPSPAGVVIQNNFGEEVYRGMTPAEISLPKKVGFFQGADYLVIVSKPGCESKSITIVRSISGWYWGNLILGGLLGMLVIDPATGAMWTLQRDLPTVKLPCSSEKSAQIQREESYLPIIPINQLPLVPMPILIQTH